MGYDADAAIAKAKAKKKELEKTPFGVAVGKIAGTYGANVVTKVTPQIVTDTVTRRYGSPTPTVAQVQSQAEAIASHDTDMDVTTFLNQAVSDGVVTSSEAESIFRKTTGGSLFSQQNQQKVTAEATRRMNGGTPVWMTRQIQEEFGNYTPEQMTAKMEELTAKDNLTPYEKEAVSYFAAKTLSREKLSNTSGKYASKVGEIKGEIEMSPETMAVINMYPEAFRIKRNQGVYSYTLIDEDFLKKRGYTPKEIASLKKELNVLSHQVVGMNDAIKKAEDYANKAVMSNFLELEKMSSVTSPESSNYDENYNEYAKKGKALQYDKSGETEFKLSKGGLQIDNKRALAMVLAERNGQSVPNLPNQKLDAYRMATNEELNLFAYYLAKDLETGGNEAGRYADLLEDEMALRWGRKDSEERTGFLGNLNLAVNTGLEQYAQGIERNFDKKEYYPITPYQASTMYTTEGLRKEGRNFAATAMDLGVTAFNMAPSILLSSITSMALSPVVGKLAAVGTKGATIGAKALSYAPRIAGNLSMGLSARGNAYAQMINQGYSTEQATAYGNMIMASEVALQSVLGGISKLGGISPKVAKAISQVDNALVRLAIQYPVAFTGEATEEGLQAYLEPLFKEIALGYDTGEEIDWGQIAYEALLGGLMGGFFESPEIIVSNGKMYIQDRATGRKINLNDNLSALISEAKKDAGSKNYKRATKLENGKKVSDAKVGALLRHMVEDGQISEADATKLVSVGLNGLPLDEAEQAYYYAGANGVSALEAARTLSDLNVDSERALKAWQMGVEQRKKRKGKADTSAPEVTTKYAANIAKVMTETAGATVNPITRKVKPFEVKTQETPVKTEKDKKRFYPEYTSYGSLDEPTISLGDAKYSKFRTNKPLTELGEDLVGIYAITGEIPETVLNKYAESVWNGTTFEKAEFTEEDSKAYDFIREQENDNSLFLEYKDSWWEKLNELNPERFSNDIEESERQKVVEDFVHLYERAEEEQKVSDFYKNISDLKEEIIRLTKEDYDGIEAYVGNEEHFYEPRTEEGKSDLAKLEDFAHKDRNKNTPVKTVKFKGEAYNEATSKYKTAENAKDFEYAYTQGFNRVKPSEDINLEDVAISSAYLAGVSDSRAVVSSRANFEARTPGLDLVDTVSRDIARTLSDSTRATINNIGKKLGVKIRLTNKNNEIAGGNTKHSRNSSYNFKNGVVTINVDEIHIGLKGRKLKKNELVRFILAHEGTHRLQETSPEAYAEMEKIALSKSNMTLEEYMEKWNISDEAEARGEIVADYFGDLLSTKAEVKALINENRSLWDKILEVIDWLIYKLKGAGIAYNDIAEARELFRQALEEADATVWGKDVRSDFTGEKAAEPHDVLLSRSFVDEHKILLDEYYDNENASLELETLKKRYEKIVEIWDKLGGELNSDFLKKWNESKGKDRVFTVFKSQVGYKYNMELSTMCKKGIPLFEAIDAIVKKEVMKELGLKSLGKAEKALLYDILKEKGFDIPCAVCYVEQARQEEGRVINYFLDGHIDVTKSGKINTYKLGWNNVLTEIENEMKARGVNFKFPDLSREAATDIYSPSDVKMDEKTQNAFFEALKKVANKEIARANKANPSKKPTPLIKDFSPENIKKSIGGRTTLNLKIFKTLYEEPLSRVRIDNDLLYSSAVTKNLASWHHQLYTLFNMQGGSGGYKTKQGAVVYWGDILKRKLDPNKVRREGGIRSQSNSDSLMYTLLDQAQALVDATAKGYYMHQYTKVLPEVKVLGLSGVKQNVSFIPKVYQYKDAFGNVDEAKTKENAGLDKYGNPWFDGIEGVEPKEAFMILSDKEYSKDNGGICIGFSDKHISKLLEDKRISLIIGFHDSSDDGSTRYKGAEFAKNYNGENEATKKLPDGSRKTVMVGFDQFVLRAENRFKNKDSVTFNGKTYKYDDIPLLAVALYLDHCDEKGLDPAYSIGETDFSTHPNYYKLLANYNLYDSEGHYAPHRKVEFFIPEEVPALDEDGNKTYVKTSEYIKNELAKELTVRDNISYALSDTSSEGVIPRFKEEVEKLKNKTRDDGVIRSRSEEAEYLELAKNPKANEAKLRKLVEEAARKAGFPTRVYHGTNRFGFTTADVSNSDDKISFFATDSLETAGTYSGSDKTRSLKEEYEEGYIEVAVVFDSLMDLIYEKLPYEEEAGNFDMFKNEAYDLFVGLDQGEYGIEEVLRNVYELLDGGFDTLADSYYDEIYEEYSEELYEDYKKTAQYSEMKKTYYAYVDKIMHLLRDADRGQGIYDLYANTDGFLRIECNGANWNSIPFSSIPFSPNEVKALEKHFKTTMPEILRTRWVAKAANFLGYKGVIFNNLRDSAHKKDVEPAGVYVFFNPESQVKSADLVTYDDNENIIPLSERFNDKKSDIRWSRSELEKTFAKGEAPRRDIDVPSEVNGKKVMRGARTTAEAEGINEDYAFSLVEEIRNGNFTYEVSSNKAVALKATNEVNENYNEAKAKWDGIIMSGKRVTPEDIALGEALLVEASHRRSVEETLKINAEVAMLATEAGQVVQAMRILKRLSPDGQLRYLEVVTDRINAERQKTKGKKYNRLIESENEVAKANKKYQEADKKVKDLEKKSEEILNTINQLQSELESEDRIANLEEQEKALKKEIALLKKELAKESDASGKEKIREQIRILEEDIKENASQLKDALDEKNRLVSERNAMGKELTAIKNAKKATDNAVEKLAGDMALLENEIAELDSQLEKATKFKKELEEELSKLRKERRTIKDKIKRREDSSEKAFAEIEPLENEIAELKEKLEVANTALNEVTKKRNALREERNKLRDKVKRREGATERETTRTKEITNQIAQLLDDLYTTDLALEEAKANRKAVNEKRQKVNELARYAQSKAGKVVLPDDLKAKILHAQNEDELKAAMEIATDYIAANVRTTWAERIRAWRYLAMLGNFRTIFRNFLGNVFMNIPVAAKNVVAYPMELVGVPLNNAIVNANAKRMAKKGISQETIDSYLDRSIAYKTQTLKVFKKRSEDIKKFVKESWDTNLKVAMEGGKFDSTSMVDEIESKRVIFKIKAIEAWRKGTNWAMERGDLVFVQLNYKQALTRFMLANNLNPETITQAERAKAEAYAIKEAQEATFRDKSKLAEGLNNLKKINWATELAFGGLFPFTKTPINVMKRSFEYSPLGLFKTASDVVEAVKGTKSTTDVINSLAKTISGSGLVVLGFYMAAQGILRSTGDDEDEEYDYLAGEQDYAIVIGKHRYTIDWASPSAIPLLLGAAFYENVYDKDGGVKTKYFIDENGKLQEATAYMNFVDGLNSLLGVFTPVFEATYLSGFSDAIEVGSQFSSKPGESLLAFGISAVTSFGGQFVPTLLGQFARIIDPVERRNNEYDKSSAIPRYAQKGVSKILNKIPGVRQMSTPYVDPWGEIPDVKTEPMDYFWSAVENIISPGFYSKVSDDELTKELWRLQKTEAAEGKNIFPEAVPNSVTKTINGEESTIYLNPEQKNEYQETKSKTANNLIDAFYNSEVYNNLTDEQRSEVVDALWDYADEKGLQTVAEDYTSSSSKVQNMNLVEANVGLRPEDYILYKLALDVVDKPNDNGNLGTFTQKEASAALEEFRKMTSSDPDDIALAYLWQMQTDGKSSNNPYGYALIGTNWYRPNGKAQYDKLWKKER